MKLFHTVSLRPSVNSSGDLGDLGDRSLGRLDSRCSARHPQPKLYRTRSDLARATGTRYLLFSVWFSVWQQGNSGEVKALKPASSDVDAHKG